MGRREKKNFFGNAMHLTANRCKPATDIVNQSLTRSIFKPS